MFVKIWKDKSGYAMSLEDAEFEISHDAYNSLLDSMQELQKTFISEDDDECITKEIHLDLPEED
ncbi:hypothetical protein C4585_01585 [Candidatus Parcubacteria bacterium]|nr:MAG: hypothetical protein C4585_01585 [Candidatus Parcubacteria bacterium]